MSRKAERPRTIVVVEDDADVRTLLAAHLRFTHPRLKAIFAADGTAAWEKVNWRNVDYLLADYSTPGGVDGITLVRRVRERHPHVRSCVFTHFPFSSVEQTSGPLDDITLYSKDQYGEALLALIDGDG